MRNKIIIWAGKNCKLKKVSSYIYTKVVDERLDEKIMNEFKFLQAKGND